MEQDVQNKGSQIKPIVDQIHPFWAYWDIDNTAGAHPEQAKTGLGKGLMNTEGGVESPIVVNVLACGLRSGVQTIFLLKMKTLTMNTD